MSIYKKSFVYLQKNIIHHENEKRYTKQANNGDIVHFFDVLGVHIYKLATINEMPDWTSTPMHGQRTASVCCISLAT